MQCDNVIRGTPVRLEQKDGPTKDFCSSFCLNTHQKKEGQADTKKSKQLCVLPKFTRLNIYLFLYKHTYIFVQYVCMCVSFFSLIDSRDPSSPASSPAPSGLPSNNNIPSTTQSYTSTNNHTTISHPPSTSNGPFQYETYQTFDWDLYLKETNSTAAPVECFKQVQYSLIYKYSNMSSTLYTNVQITVLFF